VAVSDVIAPGAAAIAADIGGENAPVAEALIAATRTLYVAPVVNPVIVYEVLNELVFVVAELHDESEVSLYSTA
jgi:hypothetical protein